MKSYCRPDDLSKELKKYRAQGKIVLVPTMGALHEGHESLLRKAREIAGIEGLVIASVFVNPIQFDHADDLKLYPRQLEKDLALCENSGVDYVFTPSPSDMYASDRSVQVDEHSLSERLCGASRPGHFSGVCTVVLKLFNIAGPTDAVFGKKDYQQLAVIRRMVRDLNVPVIIHGAETVRESDGLALSSRNTRLTSRGRKDAPVLRDVLLRSATMFAGGLAVEEIISNAEKDILAKPDVKIDYIEIVDAETLQPYAETDRKRPALMALAVFFGDVRLIDNIEL